MPYLPCSLPNPECLMPPKGATSLVMPTCSQVVVPQCKTGATSSTAILLSPDQQELLGVLTSLTPIMP